MTPIAKPATILLVEDDLGDQELTRRALEEGKIQNELHIVSDGEEALDYLFRRGDYRDPERSPHPDLILLDLNLPKLDGRQVLERLQEHPYFHQMVILVLTTSKHEEDVIRSYNLGVKSFITKPVEFTDFIDTVKAVSQYWFQMVVLPNQVEI